MMDDLPVDAEVKYVESGVGGAEFDDTGAAHVSFAVFFARD